jgi:hypothetical protein
MAAETHPPKDGPGWETKYEDFVRLLKYIPHRAVVAPLLKKWFDYDVVGPKDAAEIRTAAGEAMAFDEVYRQIESDAERRYDLYQHKMSCWHLDNYAERRYREYLAAHPEIRDTL